MRLGRYGGRRRLRIDVWGRGTPRTPYMGPGTDAYQLYGELTDRAGARDPAPHDDHERAGRVLRAGGESPRRRPPYELHGRGVRVRDPLRPGALRPPPRRPTPGAHPPPPHLTSVPPP